MKMKNKLNMAAAALVTIMIGGVAAAMPVFAQATPTSISVGASANAAAGSNIASGGVNANARTSVTANASTGIIGKAESRADQEIARRVNALDSLISRVNSMAKISAADKASLSSEIQAEITAMTNLKMQIASDTAVSSTSSLRSDIKSITESYRIFALIIPQGAVEAAADRVLNLASMMSTLSGELQTRITEAQSSSTDMSASVSALADMNAKVSDATAQANAAISGITNLQPDNGNQTVKESNTAALKAARTDIQAAQQDIVAARKDAGSIVKTLISIKASSSANIRRKD